MVYCIIDRNDRVVTAFANNTDVYLFLAATKKILLGLPGSLNNYRVQVFEDGRRVEFPTGHTFMAKYEADDNNIPF